MSIPLRHTEVPTITPDKLHSEIEIEVRVSEDPLEFRECLNGQFLCGIYIFTSNVRAKDI